MSSTRHAAENAPLSQEAYASSNAHEVGLLGNLVARRCKTSMRPEHRALCYFIQQLSRRDGGLKRIVGEIIEAFPERFRTADMKRLGIRPGQALTGKQREELGKAMQWRQVERDCLLLIDGIAETPDDDFPRSSDALFSTCRAAAAESMEVALRAMCLDPRADMTADPFSYNLPRRRDTYKETAWWVDDLVGTVELFRQRHIQAAKESTAETMVTRMVCEAANRATFSRGLAVVEGEQRTGKTQAARFYRDTHPGECVLVELESGDDETTFFRSFARSIGVASSEQYKALELRGKIEDMLQAGHLTVLVDESHFLLPLVTRPKQPPKRLDWVRRSLIDKNVPVVLVSTPQFDRQVEHYRKHVGWNTAQLLGRIVWQKPLPSALPIEEVKAVARKIAPCASESSVLRLAAHAINSPQYLFGIQRVANDARYLAIQDGRTEATREDFKRALDDIAPAPLIPPPAPAGKPVFKASAKPVQGERSRFADEAPPALARRAGLDLSPSCEGGDGEEIEHPRFSEAVASD